ncbi:MAG: hypothetical protein K6F32_00110, partial [Bacilli bacterium]|nr:hypothetical protein [Bacilli bacterium]
SCYEKQHFNYAPTVPEVSKDQLAMLVDAQASDALIVYVVDIFSFESSFSPEVIRLIENLSILVIANKRDLLPKSASDAKLREYVAHRFRCARLSLTAEDVMLTSLSSTDDVSDIAERISAKRKGHDVYILGPSQSGKSQMVNAFLRGYSNPSPHAAVQSVNYPGTQMRVLQIPLDQSSFLYEIPGLPVNNSICSVLSVQQWRAVYPQESLKSVPISVSKKECLCFSGLAKMELIAGERTQVSCYFPKTVKVKKFRLVGKKDPFFDGLYKGTFKFISDKAKEAHDFDVFDVVVTETGQRDIGIEGLGWISFKGEGQTFRVYAPKGVSVYTTRCKLPPKETKK